MYMKGQNSCLRKFVGVLVLGTKDFYKMQIVFTTPSITLHGFEWSFVLVVHHKCMKGGHSKNWQEFCSLTLERRLFGMVRMWVKTIQTELDLWASNLVHILIMTKGRHLFQFRIKGQGHILNIADNSWYRPTIWTSLGESYKVHNNFITRMGLS